MKTAILTTLMIILLIGGCAQVENTNTDNNVENTEQKESQQTETSAEDEGQSIAELPNPVVVLETSKGNIEIELYQDKAPITVENFLSYVNEGYYDGLIFHRVINNFMIQGGGFNEDMVQKQTKDSIKNEAQNGLKNEPYTIAMARTAAIDSATSQFFINVADNTFLNHGARDFGYAVFGKVTKGTEVVDEIKVVETGTVKGFQDVPLEPVKINKAYVKE